VGLLVGTSDGTAVGYAGALDGVGDGAVGKTLGTTVGSPIGEAVGGFEVRISTITSPYTYAPRKANQVQKATIFWSPRSTAFETTEKGAGESTSFSLIVCLVFTFIDLSLFC